MRKQRRSKEWNVNSLMKKKQPKCYNPAVIAMYNIELNDAKELVSQLQSEQHSMKQQLADNEKEMIEKIAKEMNLTKLKIVKEQQLVIKNNEITNLHHQLAQRSDWLSSIITNCNNKVKECDCALADKEQIIKSLQSYIERASMT